MLDYSSDLFFLQTTILTLIGPLFRNNPETTWVPEAKSGQGRLRPKGPPFHFFTFSRKPTKPDVPKGSTFGFFFGTVWLVFRKIFIVSKGSPLRVFFIICNWMYVNKFQRVPPFTFFGTMRLFLKEKFFSKITSFFPEKMFCAFWVLDMAPTLDVLVLLLNEKSIIFNFKSTFFSLQKTIFAQQAKLEKYISWKTGMFVQKVSFIAMIAKIFRTFLKRW